MLLPTLKNYTQLLAAASGGAGPKYAIHKYLSGDRRPIKRAPRAPSSDPFEDLGSDFPLSISRSLSRASEEEQPSISRSLSRASEDIPIGRQTQEGIVLRKTNIEHGRPEPPAGVADANAALLEVQDMHLQDPANEQLPAAKKALRTIYMDLGKSGEAGPPGQMTQPQLVRRAMAGGAETWKKFLDMWVLVRKLQG